MDRRHRNRILRFSLAAAVAAFMSPLWPAEGNAPQAVSGHALTLLEAVASTLAKHPIIQLSKQQMGISEGARLQLTSRFDTLLQTGIEQDSTTTPLSRLDQLQAAQSGFFATSQAANLSSISGGIEKMFRNGVIVKPAISVTRNTNNLAASNGLNATTTGVTVIFPLLRGRGSAVVGAQEQAAIIEVDASALDVSHTAAQLVSNTVASYWNLVAAMRRLEIAQASEERGRSLVENVQAFIDAGLSPRTEINDVNANLADRSSARLAAEQRVIAARLQLAVDMGLGSADLRTISDPGTPFPSVDQDGLLPADSLALDFYTHEALQRRADYLASKKRIEESRLQTVAAKDTLRPDLRFTFSTGYSSLREGTRVDRLLISPFSGVHGANVIGGLSYTFPHANSFARGQVLQSSSAERQSELRSVDIARQISSAVSTSIEGVRHAAQRVAIARRAVESFESALSGQREKYRLSLASVVDVLTTEDRLTNALLNQVDAEYSYAMALVDLRYATGTIFAPDRAEQIVGPEIFTSTPFHDVEIPSVKNPQPRTEAVPTPSAFGGGK